MGKKDEYLSRMKREEKFAPIITLVVYFGTDRPWDGAKCLHDNCGKYQNTREV